MDVAYKKWKSDVWVLGTPIYWWGSTAQFKTFVDRWYGVDQRQFQGKEIVAAIPMGCGDDQYARHTIGILYDICNYLGTKFVETVLTLGMNGRSSVRENTRALESARAAGMRIMNQN